MPGAGQYAPVGMDYLSAEKGCAAAAFEDVEIDALALEGKAVLLHLCHHLNGMTTDSESGHIEAEVAVCRAASSDCVEIALYTIDIQGYGLRAGACDRIGNFNSVMHAETSLRNAGGKVVAAFSDSVTTLIDT